MTQEPYIFTPEHIAKVRDLWDQETDESVIVPSRVYEQHFNLKGVLDSLEDPFLLGVAKDQTAHAALRYHSQDGLPQLELYIKEGFGDPDKYFVQEAKPLLSNPRASLIGTDFTTKISLTNTPHGAQLLKRTNKHLQTPIMVEQLYKDLEQLVRRR